jgi:UDPglucose--hexose-1-phosphate uridylyltransferase
LNPLSKIAVAQEGIEKPRDQYRCAAMGCSNPHPHGQIWTMTGLPEEASTELVQLVKYRKEHNGAHLLEDYAKLEVEKKERIVFQNKSFLVVCPVRLPPLYNFPKIDRQNPVLTC